MVREVTHKQLENILKIYYDKKISLIVYGSFGIGKSDSVRKIATEIAIEKNRSLVEWNKLSKVEKEDVYSHPNKYFVLMDIRLSENDTSDTKGLPDFSKDEDSVEWKLPFWARILVKEGSDGILFFDGKNLISRCDPVITPINFKIMGTYYEELSEWLYQGKEVGRFKLFTF